MTLPPSCGRRPAAGTAPTEGRAAWVSYARAWSRILVVRGRSPRTREAYLHAVAALAHYYRRPPDQLTAREVQQYLLHLIQERHLAWSSCRVAVAGLRFFYEITLGRARAAFTVPLPKGAQKLPEILSREEV